MIQQALSAINTAISENPAAYARQVDEAYSDSCLPLPDKFTIPGKKSPLSCLQGLPVLERRQLL